MRKLDHLKAQRIPLHGTMGDAYNGAFRIVWTQRSATVRRPPVPMFVIASDGGEWDHVSVSVIGQKRLPTWYEMAFVKGLFFHDDEAVMQLHPPASEYVNNGEVLHLWRPQYAVIPTPPQWMVGIPGMKPELARALYAPSS